MWDDESWKEFISGRFVKWLQILESTAIQQGLGVSDGFYLGTPNATFADTSVFALLATMEKTLPEMSPLLRHYTPRAMSLCDRLASNPGLSALFQRQSTDLYCGGYIERSIRDAIQSNPSLLTAPTF